MLSIAHPSRTVSLILIPQRRAPQPPNTSPPYVMPKDKNAPKRGMSAYMCFSNKRRPELVLQHPEWAFGEFGKTIGAEWKLMDEAAKDPYVSLSIADKARYEHEMLSYVPPPDDGKKKRKKKDPNAPKGAKSAYMFFSTLRRPQLVESNPSWKFGEYGKAIGAEWGAMSDAKKAPYQVQADADKQRYAAEMATYVPS